MPRVTVTSGGGSARYGSKCQACDGYGDIQKLRSEWLCMPCRMNSTTILTARNTAERRKDAQRQISDRRAANARTAAQAAKAAREGLLVRRRRSAVLQRPANAEETVAMKKTRNQEAATHSEQNASTNQPLREASTHGGHAKNSKRTKQKQLPSQPASETFESARTRLQQRWNARRG